MANVDSKQPDKVLFDRAMDAMKHNRFDVARMSLQTLINTYPDSEFIARAKLAVADSWYAEGGSASLGSGGNRVQGFRDLFPQHAGSGRSATEDRQHSLSADGKAGSRLHPCDARGRRIPAADFAIPGQQTGSRGQAASAEVQEVIAEREFRVGRFYYWRQSYPAAIARLKSLVDKYPLYSKADEALYLLGQSYEGEITMLRSRQMNEAAKARMIRGFHQAGAAEAYCRILTRYPLMDRADDAKARLACLDINQCRSQPKPQSRKIKAEEDSRREASTLTESDERRLQKHPNTTQATQVGEPTLS